MARDRYEDEDDDRPRRRQNSTGAKSGSFVFKVIAIVLGSLMILSAITCAGVMLYSKKVKEDIEELSQTRNMASDSALSVFQLLRGQTNGQHKHVYFNSTEAFKRKYGSEQFDELLANEPILTNHIVATEVDPSVMPTGIAPNRIYTTRFELSDDQRLHPFIRAERPENGWPEVNTRKVTVVMKESADGHWNLDQLLLNPK